jgi:hypothetical protein
MEPVTCAMTLGDACFAYFFWMWTKKGYSNQDLKGYFIEKRKKKLSRKFGFDEDEYLKIEIAIDLLKKRVKELSN